MTFAALLPTLERMLPIMLYALYMLTAVRLCRYSWWIEKGAPNPFLPRSLAIAVARVDRRILRAA